MKLAWQSIPYRALQKTTTIAISAVFIASIGTGGFGVPAFAAAVAGGFLLMLGYEAAYYRRFRYELTDDTFDIRSGVFNRREREIPYGRIQNVDISRSLVQRLVGLAELNIETAGGGSTEATLQYVSPFEARRLQQDLRRYKRGASTDSDTVAGEEGLNGSGGVDEEVLFEIAPSELALAGILSFDPRVPGLLFAVFTGSVPFVSPIVPFDAPPLVLVAVFAVLLVAGVVLAWIVGAGSAIVNYWGFRLTRSADELRYERGLLRRYSGTIPFDKIQAITIEDNPLKRWTKYATLTVETAGYAPGQTDGRGSEAAVPIADRERVEQLADEIDAASVPQFRRPPKRTRRRYLVRYLLAVGVLTGAIYGVAAFFEVADSMPWYLPAIAALATPLAAHYKWLHRGYWLAENHLVTRNGFWSRDTKRVAYYRIQTVIDRRTVFQRRWSLATVIADTAGSLSILGTDAAAVDIDQADAERLRAELTDRLRTALAERRRRRRERPFFLTDEGDEDGAAGEPVVDELRPFKKESEAEPEPSTDGVGSSDSVDGRDGTDE
ncbi:MAG: PH domain-containing protein [Halohasta sp.]